MKNFTHFKKYADIKKNTNLYCLILDFECVLDNIWCLHSQEKAIKKFNSIRTIPLEYRNQIYTEINHVILEHGKSQAKLEVKRLMEKCIDELLKQEE